MTSTALPPSAAGPAGPAGPVAALAEAAMLVDQAARTLWAARPPGELVETVEAVATLRAKLEALELAVAGELDVSPAGQAALAEAGWASVKEFLTHTAGGRKGAGPATVRLARQLEQHPALADALAAGTVSRVKVQVIATAVEKLPGDPVLRAEAVGFLLGEAGRLSADDLERAGRHVLEVVDPEGVDARLERELDRAERAAHLNRTMSLRFDRVGGGHGRLDGSAEDVLLLKTVLLSLAAPQPAEPGVCGGDGVCTSRECRAGGHSGRDPRDHGARMFDALVQLARIAQATGGLPECHGGVPQVVVTMDYDDLKDRLGLATTGLGEEVDGATVRRWACDADLIPGVLGGDGRVLDVGRTQRLVTAAIWVALVLRDQHCAFPGCRRPPVMCHAHHVVHWVGATHRRPEFRPPGSDTWVSDPGRTGHRRPERPPGGREPPDD